MCQCGLPEFMHNYISHTESMEDKIVNSNEEIGGNNHDRGRNKSSSDRNQRQTGAVRNRSSEKSKNSSGRSMAENTGGASG